MSLPLERQRFYFSSDRDHRDSRIAVKIFSENLKRGTARKGLRLGLGLGVCHTVEKKACILFHHQLGPADRGRAQKGICANYLEPARGRGKCPTLR